MWPRWPAKQLANAPSFVNVRTSEGHLGGHLGGHIGGHLGGGQLGRHVRQTNGLECWCGSFRITIAWEAAGEADEFRSWLIADAALARHSLSAFQIVSGFKDKLSKAGFHQVLSDGLRGVTLQGFRP